ncbi:MULTISPECIES: ATP-binding protein [Acinetobacter]|uniref:ATP-binding protein n=1 Tax=Acinetobacter TaxID=469 RepID=UPI0015D40184|nr:MULTISPECIES: ATP-binding protein [unclassified Acinetobacter]
MEHTLEVLKIIEGALKGNTTQVNSYATLLAEKLEKEGLVRQAENIRKKIESSLSSTRSYSPASLHSGSSTTSIPLDKESRLSLGDESRPILEDNQVLFSSYIQNQIDEFLKFIEKASLLEDEGVGIAPSMLIYGPPGCGKTVLANYIAARLDLPLITARCDSLISSYLGSTSKNLRNLFEHAASRPCVLFLDEFDSLAKARDDQHELGELKRVVVSLLQNIDNLPTNTILLAATNHHELLDPAVWRRFAYRLQIPLPDKGLRELLLKQFLGKYVSSNLKSIVEVSHGVNGAVIKQACQAAIRNAILNDKKVIDSDDLIFKLIKHQYDEIISKDIDVEEKIIQLRCADSKLFTVQRLSSMFNVSTGKISKITTASKDNQGG